MEVEAAIDDLQFQQLVQEVIALSKREPRIIVRNMARDYARTAWRETRLAGPKKFAKRVDSNGEEYWVPLDPPEKYSKRGFAKASWGRILAAAGLPPKKSTVKTIAAQQFGHYEKLDAPMVSEVTITNNLSYIGELDNHDEIHVKSIRVITTNLNRYLNKLKLRG